MGVLYDSHGRLVKATHGFLFITEEDMDEVSDFLEENGIDDINIRDDVSFITLWKEGHWAGDFLHPAEEVVAGFRLMKNQVDGEWCGFTYFSTTKEKFDEGNYGFSINSEQFLVMSIRDEQLFPSLGKFSHLIKESFDIDGRDCHSLAKNIYIADRYTDSADRNRVWDCYNVIKRESARAHYRGNTVYFTLKDTDFEGSARVTTIRGKSFVVCQGNYYTNPKDMLLELKRGRRYDGNRYGKDPAFMNYVIYDTSLEKEMEEEMER